jgi:DNA polymerase-3 subunit alpha
VKYVSLHHHSTFSYMDGYGTPDEHVARAADLGMSALALTEHGNVSSHVKLEKAANAAGIKPIYGAELYTAPGRHRSKWHLTALAETQEGYQNLNRLVTRSWSENFYFWPTVAGEMLIEHASGLIVTSGCADSHLSCTLLGGKSQGEKRETISSEDMDAAERLIRHYQEILGKDNYFLEVQRFKDLQRTRTLNPAFAELSARTGAPLVATSDCHYPMPHDNEMQKILHAAGRNLGTVAKAEASWEYDILLTPPVSDQQLLDDLVGTGLSLMEAQTALGSTSSIASRCSVVLPKNELLRFPLPMGYDSPKDLLWDKIRDGWRYRIKTNRVFREMMRDPAMVKRAGDKVAYEMSVITDKQGFCDYFLMLADSVSFAKDAGIAVGPARGSAAASLVLFLIRITEVNPLMFPTMVFERFMDVTRADMPDVDLDFADDRRDEVRQYLVRKWGADRVGNIGNFVKYKGKNSIDDVARVHTIPKWAAEQVKTRIIERSGGDSRASDSLEDTFKTFPSAQAMMDKYPEMEYAIRLEGNYRGMSVHAAGIVISNNPISDTCAVYTRETSGGERSVLAYDKKDAEYIGMLKMDFLGLSTMGMIAIALDLIGMTLEELYDIPLDEPETLRGFKENDVVGIFQFEGRATRLVCADVVPDNFMHLADINALSRPGPLFSGMTAEYVEVRHGRKKADEIHPMVDKHTGWTNGQIVYQEQVLNIIREVGGFPVTKVADIRKIISQKLGEMSFNTMQEEFVDGAARLHGIDRALAIRIWKFMVTSATYSFNVAHCVSYSMLAFWCMWLKRHHPLAFYTAQLRKTAEDKWPKLLKDARKHGVEVLPPDMLVSEGTWVPDYEANAVRAGFTQIKGIGAKTYERIAEAKAADPMGFTAWEDLLKVKGIGPKTIEKIVEFACSEDPFELDRVRKLLEEYRANLEAQRREWRGLPVPSHTSDEIGRHAVRRNVCWIGVVRKKNYQDYVENQRTRTGDSVEEILARTKDPHLLTSAVLQAYDDGDEDVYLRFNRWKFPEYKDMIEELEPEDHIVLVIGDKKDDFGISLHVKAMIVIEPDDDVPADEEELLEA